MGLPEHGVTREAPARVLAVWAVVPVVTNELVRWLPFGVYLHDAWPAFREAFANERSDA